MTTENTPLRREVRRFIVLLCFFPLRLLVWPLFEKRYLRRKRANLSPRIQKKLADLIETGFIHGGVAVIFLLVGLLENTNFLILSGIAATLYVYCGGKALVLSALSVK